jgi:aspartate aminotransferase/aminotransferase
MLSTRVQKIDASGIRKVFDLAAKLKDPINLSIGQPDFDIPEVIRTVGIEAIQAGFNRYTPTQGIPELNAAIRASLKQEIGFEPEATLVTSGVSGALSLLILALVDPGDEVMFPDPYFVMYKHLVHLADGVCRYIDTYPDFQLDPAKVEAAITPRTKLLIINSPNNPTGAVYSRESLAAVAAIARKHNLIVISDEIYRSFSYDGTCPSIAEFYPERTVVIDGFSKSAAMTGWRVGFAAGPEEIIEAMARLQQYTFVCAPSFAQKAAIEALRFGNPYVAEYASRRDRIHQGLVAAGYETARPGGAFYIFPKCPEGTTEESFMEKALAQNLLIVPGSVFSERKGYFRISFASAPEVLERGIAVLEKITRQGS